MGFDYLYNNHESDNSVSYIDNTNYYFGNVHLEPRKRSASKDDITKLDNKSIDSYFPNSNKSNIFTNVNKNFFLKTIKEDDSRYSNCSSSSTISSSLNEKNINENSFSPFKNKNIRNSYYQKLLNNKIASEKKEIIKNNTLFIFDWDDTLFFTTHINPSKNLNFFYESKTEKRMMNKIELYVVEILKKALSKGTVLIITNSSDGWVHSCAKFYYPNLLPILDEIKIISARELYQYKFPSEPLIWKVQTFNDLKLKFCFEKCKVSNIICIGDDNGEIIAAKKLGESFENCLVKTIKFRDKPNLTDLIKQIILVNDQIIRVYNYPKSLNIYVDKKKNPKK